MLTESRAAWNSQATRRRFHICLSRIDGEAWAHATRFNPFRRSPTLGMGLAKPRQSFVRPGSWATVRNRIATWTRQPQTIHAMIERERVRKRGNGRRRSRWNGGRRLRPPLSGPTFPHWRASWNAGRKILAIRTATSCCRRVGDPLVGGIWNAAQARLPGGSGRAGGGGRSDRSAHAVTSPG